MALIHPVPVQMSVGNPPSAPEAMRSDEWINLHADLCGKFEESEDACRDNRIKAERDVDYFDDKQLTSDEVRELKKRGQPPIIKNRIKRKIQYLVGLEQNKRTDPRAMPRTPKHEQDANSCTDALRFVVQSNRYDQTRSRCWWDIVAPGWGGVEVTVERRSDHANPRVVIKRTPWDRMFWDPHSSEIDFSDAGYLGVVLWMDKDEAVRRYGPQAAQVFDETLSKGVAGSFEDKPVNYTWYSRDKRGNWRVRVVQMYYVDKEGIWQFCEFTKGGYLNHGPSPWLDDEGKPEHPYSWRCAYIDRDNQRYGEIRGMIDTQDAINKRSSKLMHLGNSRQTFGTETAMSSQSERDMRTQLTKPDGHVRLAPGSEFGKDFGIIPTGDMAQITSELLQFDLAESDLQGPNASMQGKGPAGQSGRAILANQQGGALESSPLFDQLQDMDHEAYRKVWRRIRQFWTAEDWVRVTDDENSLRWVGLNVQPQMPMGMGMMPPTLDNATGMPVQPPMAMPPPGATQQIMQTPLSQVDVDIIIDDAPHVGTIQQEEFIALADLASKGFPIPPKVIIKASSLRAKGELLADMAKAEQAQANQPNPEQQRMQAELQLEQAKAQAQMQLKQQELQAKQAEKMVELQMKREEQEQQLAFEARKHAQDLLFERQKFDLEQAARAQAARDAHQNSQREAATAH